MAGLIKWRRSVGRSVSSVSHPLRVPVVVVAHGEGELRWGEVVMKTAMDGKRTVEPRRGANEWCSPIPPSHQLLSHTWVSSGVSPLCFTSRSLRSWGTIFLSVRPARLCFLSVSDVSDTWTIHHELLPHRDEIDAFGLSWRLTDVTRSEVTHTKMGVDFFPLLTQRLGILWQGPPCSKTPQDLSQS